MTSGQAGLTGPVRPSLPAAIVIAGYGLVHLIAAARRPADEEKLPKRKWRGKM
jgi:hypothetical protein